MSIKVIGAGLPRTGTKSLQMALEMLGFAPCYHNTEIVFKASARAHWEKIFSGNKPDWNSVFNGYAATVDSPGCFYFHELMKAFPQAKVILSVRDTDKWLRSMQSTILSKEGMQSALSGPFSFLFKKMILDNFGNGADREYLKRVYETHNKKVMDTVPSDKFLIFEVGQGWQPLCDFLDAPIPRESFPSVNSTEEWRSLALKLAT